MARTGGRQFVGVRHEEADLPHLLSAQRGAEPRHPGQPYAVCDLPIVDARRVVSHSLILEKFRRLGELALGDCRLILPRQPMANSTVFPVDLRPRGVDIIGCRNRR